LSVSQAILDIAEICAQQGVHDLILSPGSRNAPLALAFSRHPQIEVKLVGDERSAGYIAFGMAQSLKKPVILLCTSGTAALNYGPAIAEAYYQKVPLLVITADRPPEWIDQNDGQSIRQRNLFRNHVKQSFELPVSLEHRDEVWHVHRTINQAIITCVSSQAGPVHINAPFREPFYPKSGQKWEYNTRVPVVDSFENQPNLVSDDWETLKEIWLNTERILVVAGQYPPSEALTSVLETLQKQARVPVIGDATSNLHLVNGVIKHIELILGQDDALLESLKPDVLVTFGGAYIAKNIKQFFRKYSPAQHWHIQDSGYPPDTFRSLSRVIPMNPTAFLSKITAMDPEPNRAKWYQTWQHQEVTVSQWLSEFLKRHEFNELTAVQQVLDLCPEVHLHLSNSSPVRWVDLIGSNSRILELSSNRGTSGIDGCSSTALGHALVNHKMNLLITGDMAFFYDRNAFWHQNKVPNLKIVVLNNHGGGIFRLIEGPKEQPELEELFVTQQPLSAANTCKDFNIKYLRCSGKKDLKVKLNALFEPNDHISLLEIEFTNNLTEIYQELKASLRKNHV
jgi:2-succinyl-5-enolpyruvyl-6-hydroxy-3-cyclohexene-1-carboxylate synthase